MALTPGTRLGPYEVAAQIGAGGMGEVYRATDTHLKRQVAIKVLPEAFAGDPERLAWFQREAEVLARLNHPSIAQIHGLERADGHVALVMELVEGPTLADRIARGAIPIDEALPIATQIAEALEAAHEQGIVHRDLKPANIKVRPDGTVKVLDFGLARAMDPASAASPSASMSPTMTTPAMPFDWRSGHPEHGRGVTQAGVILGTVAYMSPEQARGKPVDRRTDIWAFGCVVYEMLTGVRAFRGDDTAETLAAVVKSEPDWTALPAVLSPVVRAYMARCLYKDPRQCIHDIAEMRLALEGAFDGAAAFEDGGAQGMAALAWQRPWVLVTAALALTATTVAFLMMSTGRRGAAPVQARFVVSAPPSPPVARSFISILAISPDGRRVVYRPSTDVRLYVRELDHLEGRLLDGSEHAVVPTISRDGQWLAFYDYGRRTMQRMPALGGIPVTLTSVSGRLPGLTWGPDDRLVFADDRGLIRVSPEGGDVETLLASDGQGPTTYYSPEVLPGGNLLLYAQSRPGANASASEIRVLNVATGQQKTVVSKGTSPRYVATGHLIYAADSILWAVPFDLNRAEAVGETVPMIDGVRSSAGDNQFIDVGISTTGSLVYVPAVDAGIEEQRHLVWVDGQPGKRGSRHA